VRFPFQNLKKNELPFQPSFTGLFLREIERFLAYRVVRAIDYTGSAGKKSSSNSGESNSA
jgi:hypothetical protein